MDNFKHIFFDLDNTLWDFETNSHEALSEIYSDFHLDKLGIPTKERFIKKYKSINEKCWKDYREGKIDKATLREIRFRKTLDHFRVWPLIVPEIAERYVKISPQKTALIEGAKEILDYLKPKYRLHIITNGFEETQYIKLEKSGIRDYFDKIITSEKAEAKKPNIKIFRFAFDLAKALPKESIIIGDDLIPDIVGGRNAGMAQVFFNPKKTPHQEMVDYEITELKELKKIL